MMAMFDPDWADKSARGSRRMIQEAIAQQVS